METVRNWLESTSQQPLKVAASVLALAGVILLYAGTGKQVLVVGDGEEREIRTHAMTVADAVDAAGWTYTPEDQTYPQADTKVRAGMMIVYESAREVILSADGEEQSLYTAERIPANALAAVEIPLFAADRVLADGVWLEDAGEPVEDGFRQLEVIRAITFQLDLEGKPVPIRSAAPTLGQALWEADILLYEGDDLQPPADTPLTNVREAALVRAAPVQVVVDGREIIVYTVGNTVGEALAEGGIALQGLDYSEPDVAGPLPEDGRIRVVRVREEVQVELEPVAFDISYQAVGTLEIDQLQILEEGTYGVEAIRVRIRLEDGEEVNRSAEERWAAVEPQTRVVGYGTNIVVRTISTPYGNLEYWRAIPVYATSYSPCNLGVDWCGYTTASGVPAQRGVVGVIRSWYNVMRGQPVYVPDYGRGSIEDIGAGFADRDWIDLGFSDEDFEGWHQWTTLYFLTPVPPLENILWILP
ncbi:MAG: DUF348 domain-containing protein [Anaerolineales bacterium]|nr:DUF348 domain-containing protein [Anaerolineales bacterium]